MSRRVISVDMGQVQDYLAATAQVPVPHKYFLRPLHRAMALSVRPPTAKQKFYQRTVTVDLPVRTWSKHIDPLLPPPCTKLKVARSTYSPTGDMFGKLLPTSTTNADTHTSQTMSLIMRALLIVKS